MNARFKRNSFISVLMLSICFSSQADALTIEQPSTTGKLSISEHNESQFKNGFSLKMKPVVSGMLDEELRSHIRSLDLQTIGGFEIKAFDLSKANNLVIGTSEDNTSVEISIVNETDGEVLVVFRDKEGRFKKASINNIGVFSIEGEKIGFIRKPLSKASTHAYFNILLDRSGSMSSVIGDVGKIASEFMDALPENARCRVTSFNEKAKNHTSNYTACKASLHGLDGMKAGGGTNIFDPMLKAYESLGKKGNHLKAVIVVTDGVGQSNISKHKVLKAKTAPTHVFWLGNHDEQRLTGIADTFIIGKAEKQKLLERYFQQIGNAVQGQHVISLKRNKP